MTTNLKLQGTLGRAGPTTRAKPSGREAMHGGVTPSKASLHLNLRKPQQGYGCKLAASRDILTVSIACCQRMQMRTQAITIHKATLKQRLSSHRFLRKVQA